MKKPSKKDNRGRPRNPESWVCNSLMFNRTKKITTWSRLTSDCFRKFLNHLYSLITKYHKSPFSFIIRKSWDDKKAKDLWVPKSHERAKKIKEEFLKINYIGQDLMEFFPSDMKIFEKIFCFKYIGEEKNKLKCAKTILLIFAKKLGIVRLDPDENPYSVITTDDLKIRREKETQGCKALNS